MDYAEKIIFVIELLGTAAFAISGVLAAQERHLDPFGAVVLGMAAAVGGGAIRDLLLAVHPLVMFARPVYAITAVLVSAATAAFLLWKSELWDKNHELVVRITDTVDSIGLSVFVTVGASAAMTAGFAGNAFIVVFVGILTGIGGGILRDILANRLPVVLHKRVYALAALAGAVVFYLLSVNIQDKGYIPMIAGAATTLAIRFLAAHYRWNLPRLK